MTRFSKKLFRLSYLLAQQVRQNESSDLQVLHPLAQQDPL